MALDLETAADGTLSAIALCHGTGMTGDTARLDDRVHMVGTGPGTGTSIRMHPSEKELLESLATDLRSMDPDIVTFADGGRGLPALLADRHGACGLSMDWGRTRDETASLAGGSGRHARLRIPGRQVLEAGRILRARAPGDDYPEGNGDLPSANAGEHPGDSAGSPSTAPSPDRIPACLDSARRILHLLRESGLDRLTLARAALTGTRPELAWTSIAAFERIYARELWARGINPPPAPGDMRVSGAAGGTVLEAACGLFREVWVFDFRSLYPSLIRTFGIDPLSHARAMAHPRPDDLTAPGGARFDREPGILPGLIGTYFRRRMEAQEAGDATGSQVYKILMNSFYGVLGSGSCRYGRTELAAAITGFGKVFLHMARDHFLARGYRVLYGDTDSVFIHAPGKNDEDARLEARDLNEAIARRIRGEWNKESFLEIRFEKSYRAFLIPPLRGAGRQSPADSGTIGVLRGRAKGYAGLMADGSLDVKGMESVRSDWTDLATGFQQELLLRLFRGEDPAAVAGWVREFREDLFAGRRDAELVYRRMLRRQARDYVAQETAPVRVARELGWTDRKGQVCYVMTQDGPHPEGSSIPLDYRHYLEHQIRPIWESIARAADLGDGNNPRGNLESLHPLDRNPPARQGELDLGTAH